MRCRTLCKVGVLTAALLLTACSPAGEARPDTPAPALRTESSESNSSAPSGAGSVTLEQIEKIGYVWMCPRGDAFVELYTHPEQWEQTRERVDMLCYSDHVLNSLYTDEELEAGFTAMKEWDIGFALDVGAVKEWGTTGVAAFVRQKPTWDRLTSLGGEIEAMELDEPLVAVSFQETFADVADKFSYAVEQTAIFFKMVRQYYPEVKIGDIEVYPSFTADYVIKWIDALQARLAENGVRGMDFFRLDVNWAAFGKNPVVQRRHWKEVKRIEDHCREIGLPFSMIYWASDVAASEELRNNVESSWYDGIMNQGAAYKDVGGNPDQWVIQTWIPEIPWNTLPETDNWTFTRSVLDFYNRFISEWS